VVSLSSLDLNLLVTLDAVLKERSVARAARRLHVTPSAVSNALARARAALGDPIVVRSGRGIVPTPRGADLAPALERTLRELEEAVEGTSFDPASTTRTFTLAVADAGQVVRLPAIAAALTAAMPKAHLRVVGIDSLVSLGGLSGTAVDVAIGVGEKGPGIHAEPLFEERTVLVGAAGGPKRLSKRALAEARHVGVEMVPTLAGRDQTARAYARAGVPRAVVVVVPTFTAAAAVAARTDLVATLPASLAEVLGPPLGLHVIAAPAPIASVTMHLTWHDRTDLDPAMVAFRELVRRSVRERDRRK
jgi:DNA-binding transcriptional LysR family regulator